MKVFHWRKKYKRGGEGSVHLLFCKKIMFQHKDVSSSSTTTSQLFRCLYSSPPSSSTTSTVTMGAASTPTSSSSNLPYFFRQSILPRPYFIPHNTVRVMLLNEPFEYDHLASQSAGVLHFSNPMPYIIGMEKFFMLLDPFIIELQGGQAIQCYIAYATSVGIWRMKKEDVVKINSIMYDMARNKQLHGEMSYYPSYGFQQSFNFDAFTAFYTNSGRRVRRKSSSISKRIIQDVEARVSIRLSGLVQNIQSSKIEPIITVHRLRIVRDDIENVNEPSPSSSSLTMLPSTRRVKEEDEGDESQQLSSTTSIFTTFI